ncbi:LamG-like jellyroll fold domain-containing protein [Actinoplanes sp. NPDC000266]
MSSAVAALLTVGAIGVSAPAQARTPAAPATPTPTPAAEKQTADPVAAAVEEARKTGEPVRIPSLTDGSSTTSANPDGQLTTTYSSSPQRVKQGGQWVPIDTTLVKRGDGSYAPKAAESDVVFGGGGSNALVSLKEGDAGLKFTWPGKLPAPTVAGDTATYANVLPDVDLQVTADATGYSSMLVVKNAKAAANPKLQKIDFGLTGTGVTISSTRNGGAEAVDTRTGETVFHADTALMWDSSTPVATPAANAKGAAAIKSDEKPSAGVLGGRRAKVKVGVGGGKQSLTPDRALLTAKTTKFPVFIDPVWQGNPTQYQWARISSNGWDVYNSTSKTGATSARIGYDNWPGGAGERARTYYQMNTAGVAGAEISSATLYVTHRWAASCYKTGAVVYGTAAPSSYSASGLHWGKEPKKTTGVLSTVQGYEDDCGTKDVRVSPAKLNFNVTSYLKTVARSKASRANFLVQAADMDDPYFWKQLGYGGGASLSVTYSYRPTLLNGDGDPTINPAIWDMGRWRTTTHTPTLAAKGTNGLANGQLENVGIMYEIYRGSTRIARATTSKSKNGTAWTIPALQDGDYEWRATVVNETGLTATAWTPWQKLTIDTAAPWAPKVNSTQFPSKQLGAAFGDKGTFVFGPDKTGGHKDNVTGYLFTLDGDLTNVTYSGVKSTLTNWTTSITTPVPGKIYYAKADNGNGTGTVVVNGSAGPQFTPGTAGAHKLGVKAVDQAGSTSPQTAYVFYAGRSTPTYATATKMVSGWTATNTDGTTTVVPPYAATTTGKVITQSGGGGFYFADGYQAVLANGTNKVSKGDSVTYSFNVPSTGLWEVGVHITAGTANGKYDLVFDKGKATAKTLLSNYDTYVAVPETRFVNFGVLKDSAGKPMTLQQGVHTVTFTMTGTNTASNSYQSGIDVVRLAPMLTCAINNPAACYNNTAISTFTAGTTPKVTVADADGAGASFEATDLKAAGWNPGATVTVNGAAIKLPAAYGNATPDNMLSSGQIVTVPSTGVVNAGNAVVFAGFTTHGPVKGATGTITYAQESCGIKSQAYTLDSLPDWASVPAGDAALAFTRYNKSNATQVTAPAGVFTASVPLACPGAVVESITLPVVSTVAQSGTATLHFFGLGIRPTSITESAHWTGSWSTAQDVAAVPLSSGANATLNGQTVRIPVRLTLATGGDAHKVRVRLSNGTGKTPVTFGAASFALQAGAGGAAAASTPVALTFGGATSVTVPAGADVVSDPVAMTVPELTTALVSLKVNGSLTALAGHRDGKTPIYTSASDSADHTKEQAATGYTKSAIYGLPFVSGVDVTTSATKPAGSLVLFGDQTVNADHAAADTVSQLDSRLAVALSTAPDGDRVVPFGVLNQGTGSSSNRAVLPPAAVRLGQNANGLVDRRILNQAGVRTVLISSGSSDLLACTGTADACATQVQDKLVALTSQLHQYRSDDSLVVPAKAGPLKVYVATLPPFAGTHTATQELARQQVNKYVLGPDGAAPLSGYADGVIDFASAVSTESSAVSDTVLDDYLTSSVPNALYYDRLAQQYLDDSDLGDRIDDSQTGGTEPDAEPIGVWRLDEGGGEWGRDVGWGTGPDRETHDAWLNELSWGQGRALGKVAATFNGTSSYGQTDLKPNVTKSFTVSAWVRLTDKSQDRTVFARNAAGYAPIALFYQQSTDRWLAQMPSAPAGDDVVWGDALSIEPAQTDVWTHLAAVYDTELGSLTLYVNGVAETSVENVTPFNDADGATWIGRGGSTFFKGDISDVRIWARPTDPAEMEGLSAAAPIADWELEDTSLPGVAVDSTGLEHNGTLPANPVWAYGHNDWDFNALTLNGTSEAITSPALLRTDQSFSVAAWARLTKTGADYTVVGQDGSQTGRFKLQYAHDCTCWRFATAGTDTAAPAVTKADGPAGAAVDTWTHLAGVYDAVSGTLKLYVNGELAATTPVTATPWHASGSYTAGRGLAAGQPANWFPGDIDAVRAYQGAITADVVTDLFNS